MTIQRTRELLQASFKGVFFFVRNEIKTEAGRRIVLHEYPNSNERFVEDLGELPPKFSVRAFVHGENYQANAIALEGALRSEGAGTLTMPTLGSVQVFALPYRKTANQTTVGEIEFNLEFAQGRDTSAPQQLLSTQETVFAKGDAARQAMRDVLADIWDVPTDSSNVAVAQFDLVTTVNDVFTSFKTVVTNVTEFEREVDAVLNNSQSLVRDGNALSNALILNGNNQGLWQVVSLLSDNATAPALLQTEAGSRLSLKLSDIRRAIVEDDKAITPEQQESKIPLWPETTAQRIKRNKNRLNVVNATRVNGLVVAYEQAANATYNTDLEVQEAREALESEHQRLIREDVSDRTLIQSNPNVRDTVEEVRLASLEVLDQKEQQTFGLTEVEYSAQIGSFELSYMLYADEIRSEAELQARTSEIRGLNPQFPSDKLTGQITVLQA